MWGFPSNVSECTPVQSVLHFWFTLVTSTKFATFFSPRISHGAWCVAAPRRQITTLWQRVLRCCGCWNRKNKRLYDVVCERECVMKQRSSSLQTHVNYKLIIVRADCDTSYL
jgi:hypothetical protein